MLSTRLWMILSAVLVVSLAGNAQAVTVYAEYSNDAGLCVSTRQGIAQQECDAAPPSTGEPAWIGLDQQSVVGDLTLGAQDTQGNDLFCVRVGDNPDLDCRAPCTVTDVPLCGDMLRWLSGLRPPIHGPDPPPVCGAECEIQQLPLCETRCPVELPVVARVLRR